MDGPSSQEPTQCCGATTVCLTSVLHEAPNLYEHLTPCSRQALSATCCFLHQWVREKVSCVRIRHSRELPELAPQKWPSLGGVLLQATGMSQYLDSKTLLQGNWQLDAQVCFTHVCETQATRGSSPSGESSWDHIHHELVFVVSPSGSHDIIEFDLTPRQLKVLSQCVDRQRSSTTSITVGPQQSPPYLQEPPTASSALYLPGNMWSCFNRQPWPKRMAALDLRSQQCSLRCAHGFVRCTFPKLRALFWGSGNLSPAVCAVLSQASMRYLNYLNLSDQGLDAEGLGVLVQACWPRLTELCLANNSLDPVAVTALSTSSWSRRLQFLYLDGNAFGEEGLMALGLGFWLAFLICSLEHCSIEDYTAITSDCLIRVHFPVLIRLSDYIRR